MSMEGLRHNPALLAIQLHEAKYAMQMRKIDGHRTSIDESNDKLETLTQLLIAINTAKQVDKNNVDFTNDPEKRELVDNVRAIAPDLFSTPDEYEWRGENVDNFLRGINDQCKLIATEVNPHLMYANQLLQDITDFTKVFQEIVRIHRQGQQTMIEGQAVKP